MKTATMHIYTGDQAFYRTGERSALLLEFKSIADLKGWIAFENVHTRYSGEKNTEMTIIRCDAITAATLDLGDE
jgi:hypothetical protein